MKNFEFPEGATEIDDISGLKLPWVKNLVELNQVEAENIFIAQSKYLKSQIKDPSKWFNLLYFKKVHKAMFGRVWDWAGSWRKSRTNIGVRPSLIPLSISNLVEEVHSWSENSYGLSALERSVRIHHKLVTIHPFENGNGRFSRLIGDRYLISCNCKFPLWPSNLGDDGELRKKYIQSLKEADNGDYFSLLEFTKCCIR